MPELPEVDVLVRHLRPVLVGKAVRAVFVRRAKIASPTPPATLARTLRGTTVASLSRRGKFLVFEFRKGAAATPFLLLGHLGMTGRMYVVSPSDPLPKHAAVVMDLDRGRFVFEDTRYFGRFTLDTASLARLGPEPLSPRFTRTWLTDALKRSSQPIKVRLLDQRVAAGMGNIYASEALHRAGIWPGTPSRQVRADQVRRLWRAIRAVLREAIRCGSTVPLNFRGGGSDRLFYFGSAPGAEDYYEERLRVYDRAGQPCERCGSAIQRITQAGRSTYFCPRCQPPT